MGVADLLEVRIVGGQPEHLHCVDSLLPQALRHADGSRRLENRVRRATEQGHLLPGHHRHAVLRLKGFEIPDQSLARVKCAVIFGQGGGERLPGDAAGAAGPVEALTQLRLC